MSNRHTRELMKRRKQYSQQEFDILLVIANCIGEDGSPATCGYRYIAELSGWHYNTVGPALKKIVEDGKLLMEKYGKYHHYNLPFDAPLSDSDVVTINEKIVTSDVTILERLSQRLSQIEQTLSQRLSQIESEIDTINQRTSVTEVIGSNKKKVGSNGEVRSAPTPDPWDNPEDQETLFKLHQDSIRFVESWCKVIHCKIPYRYGEESADRVANADYYTPAAELIHQFGYDDAWKRVKAKRLEMLKSKLTPRRLSAIAPQVFQDAEIKKLFKADDADPWADIDVDAANKALAAGSAHI